MTSIRLFHTRLIAPWVLLLIVAVGCGDSGTGTAGVGV